MKEDAPRRPLIIAYNKKCFQIFKGGTLSNLPDLLRALQNITEIQFYHHVNTEKNDFALWVEEVLLDSECAQNLRHSQTLKTSITVIEQRLKYYQLTPNLSETLPKKILFPIIPVGFVILAILIFYFLIKNSISNNATTLIENAINLSNKKQLLAGLPASIGRPTHLKIPEIDVDATIESVNLTPDGAMDVPKNRNDVAWLQSGPRPGETGSAVLAGHYGWKNLEASAFDNLYKLHTGDKLYIEDEKGMIITFVIREIRDYDQNANASDVFSLNDEKSHLNLITCEGIWDKISKSYSKRLVIFTDKE